MTDWTDKIGEWQMRYRCRSFSPASLQALSEATQAIGMLPADLYALYERTNGLECEWFELLPIEDGQDTKRTWDGLTRANDPQKTKYLSGDPDLLRRFLVFAKIGGGSCAVIDRGDGSIWYDEEGDLHQTDLTLAEFIDTSLREVETS